jgi:hypothetical protein
MSRRRKYVLGAVGIALYGATWVGGPPTYVRNFNSEVEDQYMAAQRFLERLPADSRLRESHALRNGAPEAVVRWCVAVLPGVLLAHSSYSVAQLNGRVGMRLVLYYGFGTVVLCDMWEWIS